MGDTIRVEMHDSPDPELLDEWLKRRHEKSFEALVARYAGLVHMSARRVCGDESMAAEVSQLTFITLAKKAKSLTSCHSLGGWLHRTAVFHARNLSRKQHREEKKRQSLEPAMISADETAEMWNEMRPVLDDSLAALSDKDREALVLRFYRSMSVREVAGTLGIGLDAAQKRINRATERLREKLVRRGVRSGTAIIAALATGLAADAQAAVPATSLLASNAIAAGGVATPSLLSPVAMKAGSLVALVAAGLWVGGQFRAIGRLERQNDQLEERIARSRVVESGDRPIPKTALDQRPIDWERVARELKNNEGGFGYLKTNRRLEEGLRIMSFDELATSLEEVAATELSKSDRMLLEQTLSGLILAKDPERALRKYIGHYHDNTWKYSMGTAFSNWMKVDPDGAFSWLKALIDSGSFPSPSEDSGPVLPSHLIRETVHALLVSDPGMSSRLLDLVPEKSRLGMIGGIQLTVLTEEGHAGWAAMVRAQLSGEDRLKAITYPTSNWSDGDGAPMTLAETGSYLETINATAAETRACVLQVAEQRHSWQPFFTNEPKTDEEGLAGLRAWVSDQAPELLDEATGRALALVGSGKDGFGKAAKLAAQYRAEGGSDELFVPLLDSGYAYRNKESARALAEQLSDPDLREAYLEKLK